MAAIDFPSSPSNGDTHTVGGVTYTYNSAETKWKTTINSNAFLPLSGGTVSGNILMGGEIQHDGDTDTNISFDTDTILFDTAGSERFRVGSAGQLGIGGATYGTSGQVLTSQGNAAAPQWTTVNTPDVPLDWPGGAVEAGAGSITQITFDSIDANAKRITLKWYHCGLAAAGVSGQLRLRAGSGGSIMTTSNYQYNVSYGTTTDMTANSDHFRLVHPGFTDAQHRHYGMAIIENINFSDRWTVVGNSASIGHNTNPTHIFAGGFDLPGTLDRIQFYCPSSSFADGRINILVEG